MSQWVADSTNQSRYKIKWIFHIRSIKIKIFHRISRWWKNVDISPQNLNVGTYQGIRKSANNGRQGAIWAMSSKMTYHLLRVVFSREILACVDHNALTICAHFV